MKNKIYNIMKAKMIFPKVKLNSFDKINYLEKFSQEGDNDFFSIYGETYKMTMYDVEMEVLYNHILENKKEIEMVFSVGETNITKNISFDEFQDVYIKSKNFICGLVSITDKKVTIFN